MILYDVSAIKNYKEMRNLGELISRTILDWKVPEPGQISDVFGKKAVKAYFLMHALSHYKEYGERGRVIDYGRRDLRAMQTHPYDSAFKPFYRLRDHRIPSGHELTLREIIGLLIHDLGEESGRNIVGAYVVNDVIGYLLGKEAENDADLLTNKNGLVMDSLKRDIARYKEVDDKNKLIGILERKRDNLEITDKKIKDEYQRVYNATDSFKNYVEHNVSYMVEEQKEGLLKIIDGMLIELNAKIKENSFLKPKNLEELITKQHDHIIEIVNSGNYTEVDGNLIDSHAEKFLLDIDKTLYGDYIQNIVETAKSGLIAPLREKLADVNDYVSNMNYDPILHATRIFRKARILIDLGFKAGTYLKSNNGEYEPIQKSVDYLFRNLEYKVNSHFEYLEKKEAPVETKYRDNLNNFSIMKEKLKVSKKELSSERRLWHVISDVASDAVNLRPLKLSVVYF